MMGYILPIQHDTERNYQYRMYKKDGSPHEIKGVRRVKFIPIKEDVDFYRPQPYQKKIKKKSKSVPKQKQIYIYKMSPEEERELSGKGHHVNVKV